MADSDSDFFVATLRKAGLVLGKSGAATLQNSSVFELQRSLRAALGDNQGPTVLRFAESFSSYIDDAARLRACLAPVEREVDGARHVTHDTVLRLLLNLEELQCALRTPLLQKLSEYALEERVTFSQGPAANSARVVDLPRLILNQFRWLDTLADPEELAQSMLEMVSIVPFEVQQEIILALPEVVDDRAATFVIEQLQGMLKSEPSLTMAALDALTSLSCNQEQLHATRDEILQSLSSYSNTELPVVLRFVLRTIVPDDSRAVVTLLRANLAFDSIGAEAEGGEALTLDALKAGLRFQPCVATEWLRAIKVTTEAAQLTSVDIFVLLMLHELPAFKKRVESIVLKKIKANILTIKAFRTLYHKHTAVLKAHFTALLAVGETLMSSRAEIGRMVAAYIYRASFERFEAFCQQEVVYALVTHMGGGYRSEVDGAVMVLRLLAERQPEKLAKYVVFLKGVLDYLHNLSLQHVRELFAILTRLSAEEEHEASSGHIPDEIHILLRKMLSSSDMHLKRLGVVASVAVFRALASMAAEGGAATQSSQSLIQLLELVTANTSMAAIFSLMCDELVLTLRTVKLAPAVLKWLSGNVVEKFESAFIMDKAEDPGNIHPELTIAKRYECEINSETASDIIMGFAVAILSQHRADRAVPMCAQFKLLQLLNKLETGNLLAIDGLLTCGMWLFPEQQLALTGALSAEAVDTLLHTLFFAVNWLREVINAFAREAEADIQAYVFLRIKHLVDLEGMLAALLEKHSGFVPFVAHFENEEVDSSARNKTVATSTGAPTAQQDAAGAVAGKGGQPARKRSKKAAATAEAEPGSRTATPAPDEEGAATTAAAAAAGAPPAATTALAVGGLDFTRYKLYLRELELEVFQVFSHQVVRDVLDTDLDTRLSQRSELSLEPRQAAFLLADLGRKVARSLHPPKEAPFASAWSTAGFSCLLQLSPDHVAGFITDLTPHLCEQLESSFRYISAMDDDKEAGTAADAFLVENAAPKPATLAVEHDQCSQMVLTIFTHVVRWSAFDDRQREDELYKLLCGIAMRLGAEAPGNMSTACAEASRYFGKFTTGLFSAEALLALCTLNAAIAQRAAALGEGIEPPLRAAIADAAHDGLQRVWSDNPKKPIRAATLGALLALYLDYCPEPDDALDALMRGAMHGLLATALTADDENEEVSTAADAAADFVSSDYPTLCKATFATYHKTCLAKLCALMAEGHLSRDSGVHVARALAQGKDAPNVVAMLEEHLAYLGHLNQIFNCGIQFAKAAIVRTRPFLLTTIKSARTYLDNFIRQTMPLLEQALRTHTTEVVMALRELQKSTRYLQNVCGHTKVEKDLSLTSQVPPLKRCLETLVFRAKAMMEANQCTSAFTVGVLRHRNIDGSDLPAPSAAPPSPPGEAEAPAAEVSSDSEEEPEDEGDEMGDMSGEEL